MDPMVLKAQQWVNATYGSVAGYVRCGEDGNTGWGTMYSLTRGLQHELGITALSDNFGPTTLSTLTAYGSVGLASSNNNMRTIVEATLYCKGYSGGNIDGAFGSGTQAGLFSLLTNMGLPTMAPYSVAPKVFKALLTMDAYVVVGNGTADAPARLRAGDVLDVLLEADLTSPAGPLDTIRHPVVTLGSLGTSPTRRDTDKNSLTRQDSVYTR